jgi:hypothetical protein
MIDDFLLEPLSDLIELRTGKFSPDQLAAKCRDRVSAKLSLPKRYRPLKGYPHPDYFAYAYELNQTLFTSQRLRNDKNLTIHVGAVLMEKLVDYKVPTYYASADLLTALSRTEPPETNDWQDFKLPFPAVRFLFPSDWSLQALGRVVTHALIGIVRKGEVVGIRWPVPNNNVELAESAVCIFLEAIEPEDNPNAGDPAQFYLNINPDEPLSFAMSQPFTFWQVAPTEQFQTQIGEDAFSKRAFTLILGLAMTMTAVPEFTEQSKLLQQAITKGQGPSKETVRPALWEAGFIGRAYKIPVPKEHQGGTHNSPIAHWRCGHWRRQKHGPGLTKTKLIWMKPVFVGAEG